MEENKAFMSLYEYRGHKDTDGVGSQLYRFARIIGAPKAHKIVPHSKYNDGKIEIYPKETIDTFIKVKKIFDKPELYFPFEKKIDKEMFEKHREFWKSRWCGDSSLLDIDFERYMLMNGLSKEEFNKLNKNI